jgi:hypothetical protein
MKSLDDNDEVKDDRVAGILRTVIVLHAAERAAVRAKIAVAEVRADVVAALAEGRCSTTRPRFLGEGGNDARRGREFAWDLAQSRAYVVELQLDGIVRVITILTPWHRADFIPEQGRSAVAEAFERARRVA